MQEGAAALELGKTHLVYTTGGTSKEFSWSEVTQPTTPHSTPTPSGKTSMLHL